MSNLESIPNKLLSLWYLVFPPSKKEPSLSEEDLKAYMEKLPFPAFKYTDKGELQHANTQLRKLIGEDIDISAWRPKKRLWKAFNSGTLSSYEESIKYKTDKGESKTFLIIGHLNGIGPYCSVQDITPIYKAERLIALVGKGF